MIVEKAAMKTHGIKVARKFTRIILFLNNVLLSDEEKYDRVTFFNTPGMKRTTELHCKAAEFIPNSP